MNRKQQKVIEYLLEENQVLKQQFESTGKKLRLDNHQRRNLRVATEAEAVLKLI